MSVPEEVGAREVLTLPETSAWARAFALSLPGGTVVALHGELGAGKTTLVRAMCAALEVRDLSAVTSPTFSVLHEYETPLGMVLHADLYRLRHATELEQLGWDELVARARITLIEWPERAESYLAADTVHVWLAHVPGDPERRALSVGG